MERCFNTYVSVKQSNLNAILGFSWLMARDCHSLPTVVLKKQNCICHVLGNSRQSIHRKANSHVQKEELNTSNWWKGSLAMQHSSSGNSLRARDAVLTVGGLTWAQGDSTLGPALLVRWGTGANSLPVLPGPATPSSGAPSPVQALI